MYAYPPSPTSATHDSRDPSVRLASLQAELEALEADLSDPTNPALHQDARGGQGIDPGELMRGLMDVRGRLQNVNKSRDRHTKLLATATNRESAKSSSPTANRPGTSSQAVTQKSKDDRETVTLGEMDQRVAELEDLVGSSTMTVDEVRKISRTCGGSLLNESLDNSITCSFATHFNEAYCAACCPDTTATLRFNITSA